VEISRIRTDGDLRRNLLRLTAMWRRESKIPLIQRKIDPEEEKFGPSRQNHNTEKLARIISSLFLGIKIYQILFRLL